MLVLDAEALQVFAAGTRIHQRLQRLLSAFENLLLYDNPPVEMRLLKMLQDGGEVNRILPIGANTPARPTVEVQLPLARSLEFRAVDVLQVQATDGSALCFTISTGLPPPYR